jgi:hypothetical protein
MGIELRRGSPYLYRKERHGDRVVSRYVGGGLLALAGAMMDEEERLERQREADAWRAERERLQAEDRAVADDFDRVETEVRALLTAAGYRRTRGEWRRRRGRVEDAE